MNTDAMIDRMARTPVALTAPPAVWAPTWCAGEWGA